MMKKTILGRMFNSPVVQSGFVLLTTACLVSGCGQKGPLFMPPPAVAQPTAPASDTAPKNKEQPVSPVPAR